MPQMKVAARKVHSQITIVLNVVYGLLVLLFTADWFTHFQIAWQPLKLFLYLGVVLGFPIIAVWNLFSRQILLMVYPALILIMIIALGPLKIIFQSSVWETWTVYYQNSNRSCKTIEFQMQDIGALGYNRREVAVTRLTPLFQFVGEIPADVEQNPDWIEVEAGDPRNKH
jgi:hypothetical protein